MTNLLRTRPRTSADLFPPEPLAQGPDEDDTLRLARRFLCAFAFGVPVAVALLWLAVLPARSLGQAAGDLYERVTIPDAPADPQTTFVYDRNGKLLATLHAGINRVVIPFSDMPDSLRDAVIAVEDKDFYRHGGISAVSIVRAAAVDLDRGGFAQGGSTITQQYVKLVYTGSERTLVRKVNEAIMAIKLEQEFSKDEILAKYLNTVYFGNGAYGVQAAAETYFGIPASKLSALQSATLAGLIQAPSDYDPVRHPAAAEERRNVVLERMAEQGYVTRAQADRLESRAVKVLHSKPVVGPTDYFTQYVSGLLQEQFGYDGTFAGGLRVTTTLDSGMQAAAESAVLGNLPDPHDPQAALVAIDPTTGAIRALVGGRDFTKLKLDLATQAHRQAGSAFKPFTLAAAMQDKYSPYSVWSGPSSIVIDDPRCMTNGQPWDVQTFADESNGSMTLVQATVHSVNTIYAQVVVDVGPQSVVDVAHRMGIESDLQSVCSITLGSQDVTPLEMADAYATLAARGVQHDPFAVSQVLAPDGALLSSADTKGHRALGANDADLVTFALQQVITGGTGTAAHIGRPAAGKTGTAQNFQDAWFCGDTPHLAACVWVGYPKGEIPMHDIEGYSDVFGGSIPALIWRDFMSKALASQPALSFAAPSFDGYNVFPPGSGIQPPKPPPPSHCKPWKHHCQPPAQGGDALQANLVERAQVFVANSAYL
jgi:penicillin-binding protein 1A